MECAWCYEEVEDNTHYTFFFSTNGSYDSIFHEECFRKFMEAILDNDPELYDILNELLEKEKLNHETPRN